MDDGLILGALIPADCCRAGAIGHKASITLLNHDGATSPPSLQMENTEPRGVCDGVGAANRIQLVEELADVELGRVHRDAEPPGDLLVGRALGDQRQHLDLARGQRLIEFGVVVAGFGADHDDVGPLSRRGETDTRRAGQDRRQPVGEIRIVKGERDDDGLGLYFLQASGLSLISRSTAIASPPRRKDRATVLPTLAGPSLRNSALKLAIGWPSQAWMMSP